MKVGVVSLLLTLAPHGADCFLASQSHRQASATAATSSSSSSAGPVAMRRARGILARRSLTVMMGRKFENNKVKMAKTASAYTKKAAYYGKKINQCVQEGGPNVESNRQLGILMREAKTAGVKGDVIDRNIKKATETKVDFKELVYEAYGTGGVGFIINCLSDSNNRASAEVNSCIKKLGDKVSPSFKMGSTGSVLFNFERKGRLTLASAIDEDALIELAIEAGVDDVELCAIDEDRFNDDPDKVACVVLTNPDELAAVRDAVLDAGIECAGSLVNVPLALVGCSPEDEELNLAALDKLEEIDDVDTVEHNMDLSD